MMFSFLDLDYDKVSIVLPKAKQKSVNHLARHLLGKVPALEDGDMTVWDSQAILVYLARKFDSANKWLPVDAVGQAHVTQWLSFAAKEMWDGLALARAIPKLTVQATMQMRRNWPAALSKCWKIILVIGNGWSATGQPSPISRCIPTWGWYGKVKCH